MAGVKKKTDAEKGRDAKPSEAGDTASQRSKARALPSPGSSGAAVSAGSSGSSGSSGLAILALILSVLSLAAFGILSWYSWSYQSEVVSSQPSSGEGEAQQERIEALENRMEAELAALRDAGTRRDQALQDAGDQVGRMGEHLGRVGNQAQRLEVQLASMPLSDPRQWEIAEAESLLRMANRRLKALHEARTAAALLVQVERLLESADTRDDLLGVRQALAEDSERVQAAAGNDVGKTWLELQALSRKIAALPDVPNRPTSSEEPVITQLPNPLPDDSAPASDQPGIIIPPADPADPADPAGSDSAIDWALWKMRFLQMAKMVWDSFAGQFYIRQYTDSSLSALPSPKELFFLRQRLALLTEQARTALLKGQGVIYKESLEEVSIGLKHGFPASEELESLQGQIAVLAAVPVGQELPDVSHSLEALEVYRKGVSASAAASRPAVKAPAEGSTGELP